ncbi:MAG: hypothetical protein OXF79_00110 [Chloroflexi bacterium]|nr:hypothetical protein [Chloroflexota bacterium]
MNTQPAGLLTLHFRTAILRNLIYHRALILEPIRRLAFRNMRHLSIAMADHGVPADRTVGSVGPNERVRELQDRMLRDQGSEPSALNRVLIEIATFTPVKLYSGLLYAEIEYLEQQAGEHPLSGNQDLCDFLRDNGGLIEYSKRFRHGMLHPSGESIPSEEAWISSGFHHDLPRAQMTIDTIIREARETLHLEVQSALLELPELQRWHCYHEFLTWLSNDDATLLNETRHNQLVQEIEHQNEEYPRILRAAESTQPTAVQLETNELLFQCLKNLHHPGALGGEVADEGSLQPAMDPRLLTRVAFAANPPATVKEWDRQARHVGNNLANYSFLLDAVGVLINETMSLDPFRQTFGEPGDPDGRIRAAMERLTFDQRQSMSGHSKVCVALLQGLVHAYENVKHRNPQMGNPNVDAVMADGGAKITIQTFRNIVFHVAEPSLDPYEIDDDASWVAPQSLHDLLLGFSMFLGSMTATVGPANTAGGAAPCTSEELARTKLRKPSRWSLGEPRTLPKDGLEAS